MWLYFCDESNCCVLIVLFVNLQLSKRVTVLQDELDAIRKGSKRKKVMSKIHVKYLYDANLMYIALHYYY